MTAAIRTAAPRAPVPADDAAREERVKMTRLRQTIARRLKDAQNTAAMLTTYNEADMAAIMVEGRSVIVPWNPKWCCAEPTLNVGPTRMPLSSPASFAMNSGQMASVPSRPFGPCCSVEPIGTMMPVEDLRYSSISGHDD